jgi:hypothetical protein
VLFIATTVGRIYPAFERFQYFVDFTKETVRGKRYEFRRVPEEGDSAGKKRIRQIDLLNPTESGFRFLQIIQKK